MNTATLQQLLTSVNFVIDGNGHPIAAQLSMPAWESLLDWLEDRDDADLLQTLKPTLLELRGKSNPAQVLHWQDIQDNWEQD
jgi:hypothetical protein